LLDRLFKFVLTRDKPLNAVLAGYFAKLVTLLINRKQKQLIPYVFAPNSEVIDSLLYHVYQKSIAELLNKFVGIIDHDFDGAIAKEMSAKQQQVILALIDKVGPAASDEDNLNGCSIIQEMLEVKEFYNIVCRRANVQKLAEYAFTASVDGNQSSQNAALGVINSLV
jgi:hypothetical protein